jgi:signal transduction histidine kinase
MRHRRQYVLFALVVLLPCAILVVLGWRMLSQERDMAGERIGNDQRQFAMQARDQILAQIRQLPTTGATWWSTALDDTEPLAFRGARPPWEQNRDARAARRLLEEPDFREKLEAGRFEEAILLSHHPAQRALARLRQARELATGGRSSQAFEIYGELLKGLPQLVDENGIAFRWHAARELAQAGIMQQEVTSLLTAELASQTPHAPAVNAVFRQIVRQLSRHAPSQDQARLLEDRIDSRQRYADSVKRALALPPDEKWHVISDEARGVETWLVKRTKEEVVCVRLRPLTLSLPGKIVAKQKDSEATGHPLEPDFPELRLQLFSDTDRALTQKWALLWWFYASALALVLGVSLFGGYLLWRDVNREVRAAEERSQFIAGVSHELRTPLAAIRMYAETLSMGRLPDQQSQREYADIILAEGERLGRLVDNVLDFAKIEQGKRRLYRLRPTSLPEVVRTAVRALEKPLAQQGFTLDVRIDDSVGEVQADSDALVRAILNLLTNAMKYSGKSRQIELRLSQRRRQAAIQVRDFGFGLPHDEQERIFEKFYRAPQPEGEAVAGTGLGLTIVKHVAEEHGGSVEVRSEVGKGSTFSILLPAD